MIRTMLFSLIVLLLSIVCLGQTFQYSRGWTNGKRSFSALNADGGAANFHKDEEAPSDVFDVQDGDQSLEKCLLQLHRFLRNPLLLNSGTLMIRPSSNSNNHLFGGHHQSSEIFDEPNGAETSNYAKH